MTRDFNIWVIEDDAPVRESLMRLLTTVGYVVHAYHTPDAALRACPTGKSGCHIIDLQLPGMDGLQLWQALRTRGCHTPCIMMSGHGSVSTAVQSMHQGAIDFLEKPFQHGRLLECVRYAHEQVTSSHEAHAFASTIEARLASLTRREHEVMALVVEGVLTKQIAKRLDISDKTVEVHRSRVTKKLQVRSVAQLVRMITSYELMRQTTPRVYSISSGSPRVFGHLPSGEGNGT